MVPREKMQQIAKIMHDFDEQMRILKAEHQAKIREIMKRANEEKLKKVRQDLKKEK